MTTETEIREGIRKMLAAGAEFEVSADGSVRVSYEKLIKLVERYNEGASLVRRMSAERAPLQEQLQIDHAQITNLVRLLRGALGRCRSDDPLRPEIEAALKQELWQTPAPTGSSDG